jgi:hypothetical protein
MLVSKKQAQNHTQTETGFRKNGSIEHPSERKTDVSGREMIVKSPIISPDPDSGSPSLDFLANRS